MCEVGGWFFKEKGAAVWVEGAINEKSLVMTSLELSPMVFKCYPGGSGMQKLFLYESSITVLKSNMFLTFLYSW